MFTQVWASLQLIMESRNQLDCGAWIRTSAAYLQDRWVNASESTTSQKGSVVDNHFAWVANIQRCIQKWRQTTKNRDPTQKALKKARDKSRYDEAWSKRRNPKNSYPAPVRRAANIGKALNVDTYNVRTLAERIRETDRGIQHKFQQIIAEQI